MIRNAQYLLLISLAVSAAPGMCAPSRVTTAQQAADTALAYCRAIGVTVTAPPAATALQANKSIHRNWRPRWSVQFHGQASLEVADNGTITYFRDDALFDRLDRDHTLAGPAIDSAAAIRSARAALAATGVAWEVGPPRATLMQIARAPTPDERFWFVGFPRQVNGIPYREQSVACTVDSESGVVKGFNVNFPTPPAATPRIAVTAEQAVGIANVLIAPRETSPATLQQVQLEAIQPNSFWLRGGSETDEQPTAVVAWQCRFRIGQRTYSVWVDPSSGALLGGSLTQPRGIAPAKKGQESLANAAAVRQALQHATEVFIYAHSGDKTPLAVLSGQVHPAQFRLIRQTSNLHVRGPGTRLAYGGRIEIRSVGKDYAAPFDVGTGKIPAREHAQWATIPSGVASWLVHLQSEPHRAHHMPTAPRKAPRKRPALTKRKAH